MYKNNNNCTSETNCVLCMDNQVYQHLPDDAICLIDNMLHKQEYKKGELVFKEGDESDFVYVLSSGHVKFSYYTPDGREQIIGFGSNGYLLGLHAIDDETYGYSARTLAPSRICKLRHKDLLSRLGEYSEMSMRVITSLNKELEQTRELLRILGHKTAAEKTASFILSLVPRFNSTGDMYEMVLSRHEIADLLGLSEETVCRIMAEFQRKGVIDAPRGCIHILKQDQLRMIAEGSEAA